MQGEIRRSEKCDGLELLPIGRLDQFIARLGALPLPNSDDEILRLCRQYDAERQADFAAMPWSEKCGIDWDDFHPDARALLNDPVF